MENAMKTVVFGFETFYPDFKPVYEVVQIEQDKIFIIPHVWDKEGLRRLYQERTVPVAGKKIFCHTCAFFEIDSAALDDVLIETYVCHICHGFDKSIFHVRKLDFKIIFGFKNETSYEWKLVKYKFSHVGKGGGCICPAIFKYCFEEYEGLIPKYSKITGVPTSCLFYLDDKAFLEKYEIGRMRY